MLQREGALAKRTQITLDNLFTHIKAGTVKELNLIIRADVQGSVDVLMKYLSELSTAEVKLKILHAGTGGITEGDVVLAEASNAIIIGFNVVADELVAKMAEKKGVDIRFYNIIYRITEDLQKSMVGLLEPKNGKKPSAEPSSEQPSRSQRSEQSPAALSTTASSKRTRKFASFATTLSYATI